MLATVALLWGASFLFITELWIPSNHTFISQ